MVSIYGIVDAAAYSKQLSGESKLTSLQSGGMSTSRIGFAGGEDLLLSGVSHFIPMEAPELTAGLIEEGQ